MHENKKLCFNKFLMNNGFDIVNEVTYIESSDVLIQSLKKKMKKTKGRVGRTSLARLLMYKD